ncbi:hypothetical protein OF117_00175 [Geodermatophilus sp. YIM 151500]|uniref:hypothetical protein n=1 Tax=Geodermatophilus sp. YIM 151500 TaxID=2984531 RepID=UPI0021E3E46A|nr:hypothetical protein [Geodermatophilus sp. YIM 151500]MCV2487762.1 hypothetical protein [Geodermatophilus sp. YIM 151500]
MVTSRRTHRLTLAAVGVPCVAAVVAFGPLTAGALVAVVAAGAVVAALALAGSAGSGAAPVGRRGLPWLVWGAAALAWELTALATDGLPTLSDLLDPVLARPAVRGAATAGWLAAGGWLLARPRRPEAAR